MIGLTTHGKDENFFQKLVKKHEEKRPLVDVCFEEGAVVLKILRYVLLD